jgi:hypothetical protein
MGEVGFSDVAGGSAPPALKALAGEGEEDEGVQPLQGHCGEGGFVWGGGFEGGGDAANAAQATGTVAGQFQGRNLGLPGGAHAHADHLSPPVDVGAHRLPNFCADGGEALGEFRRDRAVAGKALVVQPLQLFQLAGF